jgi:diguanylate cyclase (GGDEF)-like protein
VLKGCDLTEAQRIAESLRQKVEDASVTANGQPVPVTLSLGVSLYDGIESPDQAVDRADTALYQAKSAGRNRVRVAAGAGTA